VKATSRCFASGALSAVIVACALVLPTATLAAPGEWTSTYDWQASPTTGFGGWGSFETYAVGPGGYYSASQNGPLGLGLSMRPTGGRVYSNADPDSEVGGPKQVWQLNAPGTTRIRRGTFDHVDYAGTGERQFLRLALYGDDIEDTKYDYTPPNVDDDGPASSRGHRSNPARRTPSCGCTRPARRTRRQRPPPVRSCPTPQTARAGWERWCWT